MKIYDCFTFFNELDLLEIRLTELYDYVDYFVIVEADKTHSGKPKEFILEKNFSRYARWKDKIIHLKVKMPKFNLFDKLLINLERKTHGFLTRFIGSNFRMGKWKLDNFQREQIIKGLTTCDEEDIIMISDLDEIPRAEKISEMVSILEKSKKVGFRQTFLNHYLNGYVHDNWIGTKAVKFKTLKRELRNNPQRIRLRKFHYPLEKVGIREKIKIIPNGGWHFNNIGKEEEVKELIVSKVESELFKGNLERELNKRLKSIKSLNYVDLELKPVKLDKFFPKTILKNKKKYSHLLISLE